MVYIPNKSCWCNDIKVSEELIKLVPFKYKLKVCICKKCILKFKNNRELFIKNLS